VAVDHPRIGEMRQWADAFAKERRRRLDDDARTFLVDCVGRDLLLLASELDKLAAAVPEGRPVLLDDVARVTASGREHGNFEITDALCARDGAAAMRALALALDEGAAAIAIVGAIAATLKNVLAGADLVARGRTVPEAERELAVHPYQRRTFEAALRVHRAPALRRALVRLAEIDLASKSGMGDARAMLEDWVLALCAPRVRARGGRAAADQAGAVS
jgi:DNA polymerase-3 subunit delta